MGKYCGASIPPSHISSSKEIMVHFETDNFNVNDNGFKMEYSPTGKQNTSIQNNTEYYEDYCSHCKYISEGYRYNIGILPTISKSFSLYWELLKLLWVIYQ